MKARLEALMKRRLALANFNIEVNENIAAGNVDDVLAVTNAAGEYPVVAALGCEPLSLLVERVVPEPFPVPRCRSKDSWTARCCRGDDRA